MFFKGLWILYPVDRIAFWILEYTGFYRILLTTFVVRIFLLFLKVSSYVLVLRIRVAIWGYFYFGAGRKLTTYVLQPLLQLLRG